MDIIYLGLSSTKKFIGKAFIEKNLIRKTCKETIFIEQLQEKLFWKYFYKENLHKRLSENTFLWEKLFLGLS